MDPVTLRRARIAVSIGAGSLAVVGLIWSGQLDPPRAQGSWLFHFQDLVGGLLALIGALVTVRVILRQIREDRERFEDQLHLQTSPYRGEIDIAIENFIADLRIQKDRMREIARHISEQGYGQSAATRLAVIAGLRRWETFEELRKRVPWSELTIVEPIIGAAENFPGDEGEGYFSVYGAPNAYRRELASSYEERRRVIEEAIDKALVKLEDLRERVRAGARYWDWGVR